MLRILDADARCSRRELLSVGSLALGGLSLTDLLAADSQSRRLLTGKSIIFLFQQGGPSQFETFDPKPGAPSDIRTVTGTISTSVPGLFFGDTLTQLAPLADRLAIIRSFQTGNANHNIEPIVGPQSRNATLGALFSRVAGTADPVTAMPTSAVLFPQSVCEDVTKGDGRGDLLATGPFGGSYAPFVPGGRNQLLQNLQLNVAADRLQDRRSLQSQLDGLARLSETESKFREVDQQQEQACQALLGGAVAEALDLTRESPEVLARYDTGRYVAADDWRSAQRGARGYYTGHAKSLGKALLLARRLCEAGCGFVTVHCSYEGVWDMHADGNNLNMWNGMQAVGRTFDHAVAAFIHDVEARGLSNKILLIATGEMGRTPRINRHGGRDHWAKLTPLMLYGGGVQPGVIGQSTRDGGEPVSDPQTSANLVSTLLHAVFDIAELRLQPALRTIAELAEPSPIPGLLD
jgi:hypothetical protein